MSHVEVVLSGFSQGAQVTHKAAKQLSTSQYKFVGAIVLFGDPNNGERSAGIMG
jgi:cutinase